MPWQEWVDAILASESLWLEQITKSGKKQQINLRERLFELSWLENADNSVGDRGMPPFGASSSDSSTATLRYIGSCRNDGTLLRPDHIISMLESVSQQEFQILRIHRQQLFLQNPVK
jgi:uncharacterized protein (DUF2344 family)